MQRQYIRRYISGLIYRQYITRCTKETLPKEIYYNWYTSELIQKQYFIQLYKILNRTQPKIIYKKIHLRDASKEKILQDTLKNSFINNILQDTI